MKARFLASATALALSVSAANATPPATVSSKTLYMQGVCGTPNPAWGGAADWADVAAAEAPWTTSPISITKASIDLLFTIPSGQQLVAGAYSSNSVTPDAVTPYQSVTSAPGQNYATLHVDNTLGDGVTAGMPFYGQVGLAPNLGAHIDVHVDCRPAGTSFQGYLIIWYTT
jgi:hypothetical protein